MIIRKPTTLRSA